MTCATRAAVTHASLVLEHVPDLVRYGSKPSARAREARRARRLAAHLRRRGRLPAQPGVHRQPARRRTSGTGRAPWWRTPGRRCIADRRERRHHAAGRLLRSARRGRSVRSGADGREPRPGELPLLRRRPLVGAFAGDHDARRVAQRRTCCSRTSRSRRAACTRCATCWRAPTSTPRPITHAIGCGEEAVGDRYQRGGGNMAKAIAEECGLARASGIDVKSFCAAPVHALVLAAALIEAGIERARRRRGGRLARQARHEVRGRAREGVPDPRGRARRAWPSSSSPPTGRTGPVLRTDAVGRHAGRCR